MWSGPVLYFLTICFVNSYYAQEATETCPDGNIRLAGTGSSPSQGRVEVCYSGQWGTVCDLLWSDDDATVACRQLGYNGTSFAYSGGYFGAGNGTILLSGLQCTGSEAFLMECSRYYSIGSTGCQHSNDAGVICTSDPGTICSNGDVRLFGNSTSSGTVEVCYGNQWGTVCDDTWDENDAAVVCKQLGYYGPATEYGHAHFGQGEGTVLLGGVSCTGIEDSLFQCARSFTIGSSGCYHPNDAGVACSSVEVSDCTTGDVRLAGLGSTSSQGRVEMCHKNQWGTVCDYNWDTNAAAVVCKQLGFYGQSVAQSGAYFGQGTGPVLLGSVSCSGTETSLLSCARNGGSVGSTGCSHYQDAGVICSTSTDTCTTFGDIRLVGGGALNGTVEVCYNNQWMTVCSQLWDQSAATVVCNQLGYYGMAEAYNDTSEQPQSRSISFGGLACTGAEKSLFSCTKRSVLPYTTCDTVGVQCSLSEECGNSGDVRLAGSGSTPSQGRVEVCYNKQWGTVCDYKWDTTDAIVVCRQLGYNGPSLPYSSAHFGQGVGPIHLSGLFCTGSETSLLDCSRYRSIGVTGCHHQEDAGVICSLDAGNGCTTGAVRFAGGNSTEGRVELCYGNQWGTVCDYLWDSNEANIVCSQLGYNGPSVIYTGAYFGQGDGPIHLAGLACSGTETSLLECGRYYGIGITPCSHYQDVGVACTTGQIESCTTGDVRLAGSGSTPSQGRVEVCYNNQWGTVCDYIWDTKDANVVCSQLGYNGTSQVYTRAHFGVGSGPVLLSGLFCRGSESSLLECPRYYSIGATPCSHFQDAGVACATAN